MWTWECSCFSLPKYSFPDHYAFGGYTFLSIPGDFESFLLPLPTPWLHFTVQIAASAIFVIEELRGYPSIPLCLFYVHTLGIQIRKLLGPCIFGSLIKKRIPVPCKHFRGAGGAGVLCRSHITKNSPPQQKFCRMIVQSLLMTMIAFYTVFHK